LRTGSTRPGAVLGCVVCAIRAKILRESHAAA
jgi:hypothetical protein